MRVSARGLRNSEGLRGRKEGLTRFGLVAEFISPTKVYTFGFIMGNITQKSVKCIHSATKLVFRSFSFGCFGFYALVGCGLRESSGVRNQQLEKTTLRESRNNQSRISSNLREQRVLALVVYSSIGNLGPQKGKKGPLGHQGKNTRQLTTPISHRN